MADVGNVNKPFGLVPLRRLDGACWNGATQLCYIPSTDSTAVAAGDAVKLAGSADSNGIPTVAQCAAGDAIFGVVTSVAFSSLDTEASLVYRAASTNRYVNVCVDRNVVYKIQEDSVGSTLAATDVGSVADIVVAAVDTTLGMSKMMLDSSTAATGSSAQLRIIALASDPNNAIGDYADYEVVLNENELHHAANGT